MSSSPGTSLYELNDSLFLQIKNGNEDAYYDLFEQNWERLFSISFSIIKSKESAQDIVQEIFLSLWEQRSSKNIQNIEHYLARATKFASLKVIRDDHFRETEELENVIRFSQENNIEANELEEQLELAISNLPSRCQEVFRLSREAQLSNQEIAAKLQLSQRTVETHISNALKELRKTLPKEQILGLAIALLF